MPETRTRARAADQPLSVAGWATHVPGLTAADLPGSPAEPACGPDDAKDVLGRKGLLGKEPSTRLALCATHRALGLPPGKLAEPLPYAPGTAVVVASNLGNVETVSTVLDDMRSRGGNVVSPLDAPNASSNVIASSIAIRYGFTGPNLAVCSGATAGLDAVRLARLLLLAGRAERAVVVGVEPADPVARALAALRPGDPGELIAGAGCVLLGRPGAWPTDTGITVGPVVRHTSDPGPADGQPAVGELYGAAGVVRLAAAAAMLAGADADAGADGAATTVRCGDADDAWLTVDVTRAGARREAGAAA
ncbi:beta-ketoacyl synthase N-terminal-like domain-containing protein [Streptomyces buecherae]|uniref:Beta-ketoacyl synthase n=1 Tax=Streptomyces buecherae TaxID=2763006 RepID=A0A7H8N8T3_9ACTN|nr:beta-ketoacyl synthase N-terminal-like domain-containing protein [Streptomyces buecherae]QKW50813.1 beta-ketoacyl synthase [Streptomyces buecherae]